MAGFTKDDRIPQPLSIFDNERVRFDHRFAPFFGLTTPPPVSYNQFREYRSYTLNRSSMNLYLDASNYFHRARSILEVIPNADAEVGWILVQILDENLNERMNIFNICMHFLFSDCGYNKNNENQLCCDESSSEWA